MTISPEQDCDGGELDEALVVGQEFVVSGGDTAELLQLVEEALDEVAFLVEGLIVRPSLLSVRFGRNDQFRSGVSDGLVQVVGVVALIGDHGFRLEASDQLVAAGGIMALTWSEQQAHRVAKRIRGGMDFGAQAAAGAAQSLSIRPPFAMRAPAACWWARTMVLSIISHSRSASAVSTARKPPRALRAIQR